MVFFSAWDQEASSFDQKYRFFKPKFHFVIDNLFASKSKMLLILPFVSLCIKLRIWYSKSEVLSFFENRIRIFEYRIFENTGP